MVALEQVSASQCIGCLHQVYDLLVRIPSIVTHPVFIREQEMSPIVFQVIHTLICIFFLFKLGIILQFLLNRDYQLVEVFEH